MELLRSFDGDSSIVVDVAAARLWERYELEALDKPRDQSPPRPPAPPLPPPWRCLVHRATEGECYRCIPPPAPGDAASWMLRGDAGCDKFGEKLIRAALLRTPEWQSANSAGFSRELGALVSARDASKLRKAHFLELCYHWHYASPYWTPRSAPARTQQPRARARPAALPAAGREESPLPLARPAPSPTTALRRALMHDVTVFACLDPSFTLPAAIAAEPLAPFAILVPDVMRGIMQMHHARAARALADAHALAAASSTAAYDYCAGDETAAAEHHLLLLHHDMLATQAALAAIPAAALKRMCGPDRAVIQDINTAMQSLFVLFCRASSELAGVRQARDASRAEVLTAAASVCAAVAEMNLLIERRMKERIECVERGASRPVTANAPSPYLLALVDEFERLGFQSSVQDDPFFAQMRAATRRPSRCIDA